MTPQLKTLPTTQPQTVGAIRKSTKDPSDPAADQFAAMLASTCVVRQLPPLATPSAKLKEADLVDGILNPEVAVCDMTLNQPPPVLSLPATFTEIGETQIGLPLGVTLPPTNSERAPASPLPIPPSSLPQPPIALPIPSSQTVETNPGQLITLPLSPNGPVASPTAVDPMLPAVEGAEIRLPSDGPDAPSVQVVANSNLDQHVLQVENARREANLMAGYLATSGLIGRENGGAGVKTLLAGNGFDLHGNQRERELPFDSGTQITPLSGDTRFAALVRDLQSNDNSPSIQAQTIKEIITQSETLSERQMRSFRLRLKPAELGQIDIQVNRDAQGRISAHISAESEAARGTLLRSLDELRDTLARAGLSVDKLQISADPGLFAGNRGSDDARTNTRGSPSGGANLATTSDTESGAQTPAVTERLLSLRA
jgi:Flagellar hook-length control protein FliK